MKLLAIILTIGLAIPVFISESEEKKEISIEVLNEQQIGFEFSVKYLDHRKQIHIRSDEAIKTLRLVNADKTLKSYDIIGSNLVLLPLSDFTSGQTHFIETKFLNSEIVAMTKVDVPEGTNMSMERSF